ncbi:hypothetical protein Erwinia_phage_Mauresque_00057 [Erwinia phage Mauresque]|nr:hypothetical protein Erwinia_phage_Mauresque_00057 [Erwinia phage Mauresque]
MKNKLYRDKYGNLILKSWSEERGQWEYNLPLSSLNRMWVRAGNQVYHSIESYENYKLIGTNLRIRY